MTIQTRYLLPPPNFADDKNVRDFMQMANYSMKSDAVNFNDVSASTIFVAAAVDSLANILVLDVICQVVTAFNGVVPTLSLGISGTVERHIAAADIDLTTVGFYRSSVAGPFEYTTSTNLIATIVPGGSTTGVARFWATYRADSNLQYQRP